MISARSSPATMVLVAVALAVSAVGGCSGGPETLRIGVLLPFSGPHDVGWKGPLEWAVQNINAAGGVAGQRLEFVFADSAVEGVMSPARRLADDPSILAVIGPHRSDEMFDIAPTFERAQKVLVSPAATSADIFRAFAGNKYIWRTVESSITQIQTLLVLAARKKNKRVALITGTDAYGATFFDWFGFFATELGLEVAGIVRYDQSASTCEEYVDKALLGSPDLLIGVPSSAEAAVCIARRVRSTGDTQLMFPDSGRLQFLIDELGPLAEGIEGTMLAARPSSGFEIAYRVIFDQRPPAYAGNVYDAVTLIAYGLEHTGGTGGEALADAMIRIVDARGDDTGWNKQGIGETLAAIRSEDLPNISGASSMLDFDADYHVDPVSSTYGYWRVEYGEFVTAEYLSSRDESRTTSSTSAFRSIASEAKKEDLSQGGPGNYTPQAKTGLWVFIVALSEGWPNYRHQADALAQYRMFRANGVSDERIFLIMNDDIAGHPENAEPGVVRNVVQGANLYPDVVIDYRTSDLSAAQIMDILGGKKSSATPTVVESTEGDNVFAFIVGHGGYQGAFVGVSTATYTVDEAERVLTPKMISTTVQTMFDAKRYRKLLMAVEACHAGVLGESLDAPGSLLMTGANPFENSLGVNYDPMLEAWLANDFAFRFFLAASANPDIGLTALYGDLYRSVSGSHVSVYNAHGFGNIQDATLREFLTP